MQVWSFSTKKRPGHHVDATLQRQKDGDVVASLLAQVSGLTVDVPLIPTADRQEHARFIRTHLGATDEVPTSDQTVMHQEQPGVPPAPSVIADETVTSFAASASETLSDAPSSVSDHSQTTS